MIYWEYCSLSVDEDIQILGRLNALNELGRQGWELVTMRSDNGDRQWELWTFKRPLPVDSLGQPQSIPPFDAHGHLFPWGQGETYKVVKG